MPSTFGSLRIYIQADADELQRLNLGLLVLGYGGIVVDLPGDAQIIVITDPLSNPGKNLIATYSVGLEHAIAVAVVDQKWIQASISERRAIGEFVGGVPCGGFYIRPEPTSETTIDLSQKVNCEPSQAAHVEVDDGSKYFDSSSELTEESAPETHPPQLPTDGSDLAPADPAWKHPSVDEVSTELGCKVRRVYRQGGVSYTKQEVAALICYLARTPDAHHDSYLTLAEKISLLQPWWDTTDKMHSLTAWLTFHKRHHVKLESAADDLSRQRAVMSEGFVPSGLAKVATDTGAMHARKDVDRISDSGIAAADAGEDDESDEDDVDGSAFSSSSLSFDSDSGPDAGSGDHMNGPAQAATEGSLSAHELVAAVSRELAGTRKNAGAYTEREIEAIILFLSENPELYFGPDRRRRPLAQFMWGEFNQAIHQIADDIPDRDWRCRVEHHRRNHVRLQQAADALRVGGDLQASNPARRIDTKSQAQNSSGGRSTLIAKEALHDPARNKDPPGDNVAIDEGHILSDAESIDEPLALQVKRCHPALPQRAPSFTPARSLTPSQLVEAVVNDLADRGKFLPWGQAEVRALIKFLAANPHVYRRSKHPQCTALACDEAWQQFNRSIDQQTVPERQGAWIPSRSWRARQEFHQLHHEKLDKAADALRSQQHTASSTTNSDCERGRNDQPIEPLEINRAAVECRSHVNEQLELKGKDRSEIDTDLQVDIVAQDIAFGGTLSTVATCAPNVTSWTRPKVGFTALAGSRKSSYSSASGPPPRASIMITSAPFIAPATQPHTGRQLKDEATETALSFPSPSTTGPTLPLSPPSVQNTTSLAEKASILLPLPGDSSSTGPRPPSPLNNRPQHSRIRLASPSPPSSNLSTGVLSGRKMLEAELLAPAESSASPSNQAEVGAKEPAHSILAWFTAGLVPSTHDAPTTSNKRPTEDFAGSGPPPVIPGPSSSPTRIKRIRLRL